MNERLVKLGASSKVKKILNRDPTSVIANQEWNVEEYDFI